jgi:hypothetical protein
MSQPTVMRRKGCRNQRSQNWMTVTDREDEESRLPEKLRNLSITTTDDELTGNITAIEFEELS